VKSWFWRKREKSDEKTKIRTDSVGRDERGQFVMPMPRILTRGRKKRGGQLSKYTSLRDADCREGGGGEEGKSADRV